MTDSNVFISVVSPVYGAEELIDLLIVKIKENVEKISDNYEIILVDDCGPGNSWQKIKNHSLTDIRVRGVKLSRNFGQHYAISAGLEHARGEWTVVMDCDLQDQPEEIIKLYIKAKEGYDIVLASRYQRKDSFFKKLFSRIFYKSLSYLTGSKHNSTIANFGIYNKKVVKAICSMKEHIRYFPTMVSWVGFKKAIINVEHAERPAGQTSYNLKKLFNLALDIILAYSDKPLRLTVKAGGLISILSMIGAIITLIRHFMGQIIVTGYASLIISIWFLSGLIILILGIIGMYIGKIFQGVKNRPIYIIDEVIN